MTSYGSTSGDLFVFGHSEGAVMAASLAGHDPQITNVVFIGGSGTTQLFDFIAGAYRKCFDVSVCIAEIDRQLQAINANPSSSNQFSCPLQAMDIDLCSCVAERACTWHSAQTTIRLHPCPRRSPSQSSKSLEQTCPSGEYPMPTT